MHTKVGFVRSFVRPGFVRRLVRALFVGLVRWALCVGLVRWACSLSFCTRVPCWARVRSKWTCTCIHTTVCACRGLTCSPCRLCALELALCVLVRKLCFWLCAPFVRLPVWVGAHDSIRFLRTPKSSQFLTNPHYSFQTLAIPCNSLLSYSL